MTPWEVREKLEEIGMGMEDLQSLHKLLRKAREDTALPQERWLAELEETSAARLLEAFDGVEVEAEDLRASWIVVGGVWNSLRTIDELTPRPEECREHPKPLVLFRRRAHGFVALRCFQCRRLLDVRSVSPPESADLFAHDLEGVAP